jgi:hypothetical protein
MDSDALFSLKLQQLLAPPEQRPSWQPWIDLVKGIDQWERDSLRAIQTCVDAIRATSRQ